MSTVEEASERREAVSCRAGARSRSGSSLAADGGAHAATMESVRLRECSLERAQLVLLGEALDGLDLESSACTPNTRHERVRGLSPTRSMTDGPAVLVHVRHRLAEDESTPPASKDRVVSMTPRKAGTRRSQAPEETASIPAPPFRGSG